MDPDALFKVFSFLSPEEVGNCCLVSKTWRAVGSSHTVWYPLCQRSEFPDEFSCSCPLEDGICTLRPKLLTALRVQRNFYRGRHKKMVIPVKGTPVAYSNNRLVIQETSCVSIWNTKDSPHLLFTSSPGDQFEKAVLDLHDDLLFSVTSDKDVTVFKLNPITATGQKSSLFQRHKLSANRLDVTKLYYLQLAHPFHSQYHFSPLSSSTGTCFSSNHIVTFSDAWDQLKVLSASTGDLISSIEAPQHCDQQVEVVSSCFSNNTFVWISKPWMYSMDICTKKVLWKTYVRVGTPTVKKAGTCLFLSAGWETMIFCWVTGDCFAFLDNGRFSPIGRNNSLGRMGQRLKGLIEFSDVLPKSSRWTKPCPCTIRGCLHFHPIAGCFHTFQSLGFIRFFIGTDPYQWNEFEWMDKHETLSRECMGFSKLLLCSFKHIRIIEFNVAEKEEGKHEHLLQKLLKKKNQK